jgi:hypothetical protein
MYYDEHSWQSQKALPITIDYIGSSIKLHKGDYVHLHFPNGRLYSSAFLRIAEEFSYPLNQCGFYDWTAMDTNGHVINRGRVIVFP